MSVFPDAEIDFFISLVSKNEGLRDSPAPCPPLIPTVLAGRGCVFEVVWGRAAPGSAVAPASSPSAAGARCAALRIPFWFGVECLVSNAKNSHLEYLISKKKRDLISISYSDTIFCMNSKQRKVLEAIFTDPVKSNILWSSVESFSQTTSQKGNR